LARGGQSEEQGLREIEALAAAVGGRQGDRAAAPSRRLMRRLLRIERRFARPHRS
jgi:hypothetical protein